MTTQVTAPPATERRPSTPKALPADKPTTTLTVPAKPAAGTAANVAVIGGTAMAAAGPAGWVVAGVVTGSAAAGYTVYRMVRRRTAANQANTSAGSGGGSLGWPGTGRGRGGSGRHAAGGAGQAGRQRPSPTGRTGSAPGGGSGGRTGPGGAGRDRSRSLLDRLGRGLGLGRGKGGTAGSGSGSRSGGAGGSGGGKAGKAGMARRAWSAAKNRAAAHKAAKAAKQATNAPGGRSPGGNPSRGQRTWGWMRKVMRRNILGHKPTSTKDPAETKKPTNTRVTGDKVNRPRRHGTSDQNQRGPVPTPGDVSTFGRNPIMAGQKQPQGTTPLFQAARQVHATAASYKPKGMLARRLEAYEMPLTLGEIAAGLRLLAHTHTSNEPLNSAYAAAVMQIAATVETAAQASKQLFPAFDALHPTQVRRLLNPQPGEEMWDTINNR